MSNQSSCSDIARNVNMEEQEEKGIDTKCHGKLNYNAPLLSTRRPSGGAAAAGSRFFRTSSQSARQDSSNRVPFSWEETPGNPKDLETNVTHGMAVVPPPNLPPGRWRPANEPVKVAKVGHRHRPNKDDDGCDGDIEDDNDDNDGNDNDYDVFSDAIDIFSLSESVDMVESCDKVEEEEENAESPSFIIQRFLADASALAGTSGLALSKNLNKKLPRSSGRKNGQSESAPQGCGFEYFLPWRMKHKPCGLKSPVREASLNAKPEWGGRRKQKR